MGNTQVLVDYTMDMSDLLSDIFEEEQEAREEINSEQQGHPCCVCGSSIVFAESALQKKNVCSEKCWHELFGEL